MRGIQKGNISMFKLLIENGALPSINTRNKVNISDIIKSYVNICIYNIIVTGHIYVYIYINIINVICVMFCIFIRMELHLL